MISVTDALALVEKYSNPLKSKKRKTVKSYGYILAEDVVSPINMPPFKQSSMDGYAYKYSETNKFTVVGEVQTGDVKNVDLKEGEAIRIFTGARIPDSADTVVMQEHVSRNDNELILEKAPLKGANVRELGEQIKTGEVALEKGTYLNEAGIGFLAGLGIENIDVYNHPKVGILITGNEIKKIGDTLEDGQIYDSNSLTLKLAVKRLGIKKIKVRYAVDTLEDTKKQLQKLLNTCDVIMISGGISVGDYDFVQQALIEIGAEEIFYKINQKPGKPLWFGKLGEKMIFALPGNPASSLTCFYVYAWPLLKGKMGFTEKHLPLLEARASSDINNSFGKTLFLKGDVKNGEAYLFTGQASSMLKSFAISKSLLVVPDDVDKILKGESVSYLKLD